jgi:hypothetical protein
MRERDVHSSFKEEIDDDPAAQRHNRDLVELSEIHW